MTPYSHWLVSFPLNFHFFFPVKIFTPDCSDPPGCTFDNFAFSWCLSTWKLSTTRCSSEKTNEMRFQSINKGSSEFGANPQIYLLCSNNIFYNSFPQWQSCQTLPVYNALNIPSYFKYLEGGKSMSFFLVYQNITQWRRHRHKLDE